MASWPARWRWPTSRCTSCRGWTTTAAACSTPKAASSSEVTDYRSGQYLHADFNAGFPLADGWKLGLQGYYLRQTTDDKQAGQRVGGDCHRAQVLALGPGLLYQGKAASVEFKVLGETRVRNHSSGSSAWLKVVWRL